MTRKKIIYVLSRNPWPTDTGMKGLIDYWCKLLNQSLNFDIYLFFATQENIDSKLIPSYIKGYKEGKKVNGKQKIKSVLSKSTFNKWPLQCSAFYSKDNAEILKKYVKEIQPDICIFDMLRTFPYFYCMADYKCKKIMDMDDLLSKRYKLLLKNNDSESNLLGNFSSNFSSFTNSLINKPFVKRNVLNAELRRTIHWEKKCASMFDANVFVSEGETKTFNSKYNTTTGYTIPIGVDFDYFSKTTNILDNHILTFLGNYTYDPNAASVKMICEEILPKLNFKYEMRFIGFCPDWLKDKYASKNVNFLGKVQDTRTVIGESRFFLAPITYGTGIKTKIIESMAMGKCIITNLVGAENIDATNQEDFFVFETNDEIVNFLNKNIENLDLISKTGENAKKVIANKYTYDSVLKNMAEIFK